MFCARERAEINHELLTNSTHGNGAIGRTIRPTKFKRTMDELLSFFFEGISFYFCPPYLFFSFQKYLMFGLYNPKQIVRYFRNLEFEKKNKI